MVQTLLPSTGLKYSLHVNFVLSLNHVLTVSVYNWDASSWMEYNIHKDDLLLYILY